MNPLDQIRDMLKAIGPEARNKTGDVFINNIKNEFVLFQGEYEVGHVPVKELDYASAVGIVKGVAEFVPEYLAGHDLMRERKPAAEQHTLQFVKKLPGKFIDFIHIYKLDMKYGGGGGRVLEKGTTDRYPSFVTDRAYFKSELIPVVKSDKPAEDSFLPVRVFDLTYTESDQAFHTFAMFEDINYRELTRELHVRMDLEDVFPISLKLYPFIVYDYFTSCINVLRPTARELERACAVFEPLFLLVYSKYKSAEELLPAAKRESLFPGLLIPREDELAPTDAFTAQLREYFGRFRTVRDDELSLKGWWRIDCDHDCD
ncbi:MAG: hypothetical protein EPN93_12825 [Spirochaetes bacterium]|nr:MAG: hypothetical protein EPN93_12825 [Spirochaetota bacterium]